jgi:hypothetical protein
MPPISRDGAGEIDPIEATEVPSWTTGESAKRKRSSACAVNTFPRDERGLGRRVRRRVNSLVSLTFLFRRGRRFRHENCVSFLRFCGERFRVEAFVCVKRPLAGGRESKSMKRLSPRVLVLLLALLVPAVAAQALPVWLPGGTVVGAAGPQSGPTTITAMMLVNNSASVIETADSVTFMNGMMTMPGMWTWSWDSITLDRDPNVSSVGSFTNIGAMAMDFIFSVATPISPSLSSTLYGGSTSVTFSDANFDGLGGLSNDTGGNPAYTGTIDGVPALNMLVSLSLVPAFPGDATQTASETQGLPGPTIAGGAATSTIGILHRFNLSPLDSATYNSTFQVVIPEPSTIALVGFGALGLLAAVRRAKARR